MRRSRAGGLISVVRVEEAADEAKRQADEAPASLSPVADVECIALLRVP